MYDSVMVDGINKVTRKQISEKSVLHKKKATGKNFMETNNLNMYNSVMINGIAIELYVETRPPVIRTGKNEYGRAEIWVDV